MERLHVDAAIISDNKIALEWVGGLDIKKLSKYVVMVTAYVTHLHETSRMSAEFVFRYGPKCMGGVILPILVLLHL